MPDLDRVDPRLLEIIEAITSAVLTASDDVSPEDLMLVGTGARDVMHSSFGRAMSLRASDDFDLALAVRQWSSFKEVVDAFDARGQTGLRVAVAGMPVDLLPFGAVESPRGAVLLPGRVEPVSVWAFREVFDNSLPLRLSSSTIRLPAVAGYLALKLCAWLDRSIRGQYKDAPDIAVVLDWYSSSADVADFLFGEPAGIDVLMAADGDPDVAALFVAGTEMADVLGEDRCGELAARWSDDHVDLLVHHMAASARGTTVGLDSKRRAQMRALATAAHLVQGP